MASLADARRRTDTVDLASLPPAGSPVLFSTLLARLQAAAPAVPLDPVVLQSLLLCMIAGDKHLVLRAHEEDVSLVLKLVALILSAVFGRQTHKLKIRPPSRKHPEEPQHPTVFLRMLFLPTPPTSTGSHRHGSTSGPARAHSRYSNSSAGPTVHAHPPIHRSASSPARVPPSPRRPPLPLLRTAGAPTDSALQTIHAHVIASESHSETERAPLVLPDALVVSGLEYAGLPAQRALLSVLNERRVILEGAGDVRAGEEGEEGVWNLPAEFIVVYVCPADPRERPAIHKSLLDSFAMSTSINLRAAARDILSFRRHSSLTLLADNQPSPLPHPTQALLPQSFLLALRHVAHTRTHISPTLSLYTSDLFSAARAHPALDGTLLGARARSAADALAQAARVLGGDGTGAELIKAVAVLQKGDGDGASSVTEGVWAEPPHQQDGEIDDVGSVKIGLAPWDAATAPSLSSRHSVERSSLHSDLASQEREGLDVSEADVARIVPRVFSHRLRVRAGPADEVLGSAMYGAVQAPGEEEEEYGERTTVKDVLVSILAEV